MLLQILLDALRLPQEKGDVLIGILDEGGQDVHGLFKFLGELLVFLIAPAVAEGH